MLELTQWIRSLDLPRKPWLLLGKGPSFSHIDRVDRAQYNTISLNHVVQKLKVDVAHMIDLDVVEACGDALLTNCRYLVMPRHPHVNCRPTAERIEDIARRIPVLRKLAAEKRLVWYNLATSKTPAAGSPVVGVRYFSAEAALNILGQMGVKQVRSLGVDGGRGYSGAFKDIEGQTMLANGRVSFDCQAEEIAGIVAKWGMDYAPLYEPMRVFVGTDESQMVATRVLEHSIRKHASRPVTVHPMLNLPIPVPKHEKNRGRTGFSFARFVIPQLCGYRGRGLYTDADMQVFTDLAELWEIPFGDRKVLCTNQPETPAAWKFPGTFFHPGRQMSVMLLDCARLDWKIEEIIRGLDEDRYGYKDLMFEMCVVRPEEIGDDIPPAWNCLEWYEPGKSKLTHYTVVPTQPWKNDENPLRHIWEQGYREAVAAGTIPADEVLAGIRAGHLKASLAQAFDAKAWKEAEERAASGTAPKVHAPHATPGPMGSLRHAVRGMLRRPVRALRRVLGRRAA